MSHEFDDDLAPELDDLLRAWHGVSAERARAGRERLIARLQAARADAAGARAPLARATTNGSAPFAGRTAAASIAWIATLRRIVMSRYTPALASLALLVVLVAVLAPFGGPAHAEQVMVPDGGRLDAFTGDGVLIGPCPLQHTDVQADISGRFARVTLQQRYRNPYDMPIEAVYTFPLSHRAAVDRLTMTVGDRVVVGSVKERHAARRMYAAAREQGYVASLLEQERPNIFTQSIANIAPGTEVVVEISYVETIESSDGLFGFEFPMVVGPRYIPGRSAGTRALVPAELEPRTGVVLLGPARLTLGAAGDVSERGILAPGRLHALLRAAQPIEAPGTAWRGGDDEAVVAPVWYLFEAVYADGARETGRIHVDGTGQINGRWFFTDPALVAGTGTGFAPDTDQVPDASRITPMPVRPPTRAGHDIDVRVTIDTGGPAIAELDAPLHELRGAEVLEGPARWSRLTVELADDRTIPNRDFVLRWRLKDAGIEPAHFAHAGPDGKFFTLVLAPPQRVAEADVAPRELIFVLDTSGSMSGFPIEKAKDVMTRAIDAMRERDTFNVITFAGHTAILWDEPRPANAANRAAARSFVEGQHGGGGTEMMKAIEAALRQPPVGDDAQRTRLVMFLTDGFVGNDAQIIAAVNEHAGTTRVFSFGIGNSVNRHLLDSMARAGRGTSEFVLLSDDADAAVERFTQRIETPVLTDIEVVFGDGLAVRDTIPALDAIPDLFDVEPLVIHGRYDTAGSGTVTLRGRTGAGRWERVVPLELPERADEHDVVATLWARARVGALDESADREAIVDLGTRFGIVTAHTSFVAIEHSRVEVNGRAMLVPVPIELPDGTEWDGFFGSCDADQIERLGEPVEGDVALGFTPQTVTGQPVALFFEGLVERSGAAAAATSYHLLSAGARRSDVDRGLARTAGVDPNAVVLGAKLSTITPSNDVTAEALGDRLGGVGAIQFGEPSPLSAAVVQLQQSIGLDIQPDWPELHLMGIDGQESIVLDGPTMPAMLDGLVRQLPTGAGAAQWTVNADGAIVITSDDAVRDRLTRPYDVRDLVALGPVRLREAIASTGDGGGDGDRATADGDDALAILVATIRERVDPDGWATPGRGLAAQGDGEILVTTSAAHQDAVHRLLDALREAPVARAAAEAEAKRRRLARVLDDVLHALVHDAAAPVPPSVLTDGERVVVSMRLRSVDDDALAAVRGAGLRIHGRVDAIGHVVGSIARDRLAALALLEPVRRVEAVTPVASGG